MLLCLAVGYPAPAIWVFFVLVRWFCLFVWVFLDSLASLVGQVTDYSGVPLSVQRRMQIYILARQKDALVCLESLNSWEYTGCFPALFDKVSLS